MKKRLMWQPWVLPLSFLAFWQVLGSLGYLAAKIMPTPVDVLIALQESLIDGSLLRDILVSSRRAFIGFLIGGSIAFILGLLNGLFSTLERFTDSSVQMLRTIPHLAMIPLVITLLGIGEETKLFLIAYGVAFPIYLNTFHGIRSVDPRLIEMGKVYGLNTWSMFRRIILPGAMSSVLVGVRFSLGVMWMTLIVAETIASDSGIGFMASRAREFTRMDVVVLSILLYALLGKMSDLLAKKLEQRWLKWHPGYRSKQE